MRAAELIGCEVYDVVGEPVGTVHDLHFKLHTEADGGQACALDALECDQVLTSALGSLLAKSYLAVKRLEFDTFSKNDEAFEVEGVRGIRIYRKPAHVFGPLRSGADRAGAILAVGDSAEEALERADRARSLVRFEVEHARVVA